jgi:DNA-binding HxlR family transcriptional regulator
MFRDRTLVPGEAVRLLALGALMEKDHRYGELATEIRFFTQRIVGPSLDLLGSSLELLRLEGLSEAIEEPGPDEQTLLRITPQGRDMFNALMMAQLRAPVNDVGRLVLLLKLRFLEFLSDESQEDLLDLLGEIVRTERGRAAELAAEYADRPLAGWLAFDVAQADQRIAWLDAALDELDAKRG